MRCLSGAIGRGPVCDGSSIYDLSVLRPPEMQCIVVATCFHEKNSTRNKYLSSSGATVTAQGSGPPVRYLAILISVNSEHNPTRRVLNDLSERRSSTLHLHL